MIKVLLVEDSPIAKILLTRLINSTTDLTVVGTASTGVEGLELIPKLKPDVICTDLHMPKMDGLEFTSEVMTNYPTPILVISASVQEEDTRNVFLLLQAGAVDIFPKPRAGLSQEYDAIKTELINRIRVLSGVKVFRRSKSSYTNLVKLTDKEKIENKATPVILPIVSQPSVIPPSNSFTGIGGSNFKIITIGSSTGGPQALLELFSNLPSNLPVPIVCIQHISEGFLQGLLDWLSYNSRLKFQIAKHLEVPQPGFVYFPPEKHHLELDRQGRFLPTNAPPLAGHCPSVTVTFKAIAKFYRNRAIGVLLTGMGRDGAEGLLELDQAGSFTIAQDEATSVVFGMPKEAIALGAAQKILPIQEIVPVLLQKLGVHGSGFRL